MFPSLTNSVDDIIRGCSSIVAQSKTGILWFKTSVIIFFADLGVILRKQIGCGRVDGAPKKNGRAA